MRILHITPHLGGGVGEVIKDFVLFDKKNHHIIFLLDKINYIKKKQFTQNKITFRHNIYKNLKILFKHIIKNDIILVHWWNHPMLSDLIINYKWPSCRLVFWSHILGLKDPNGFTRKILKFPDRFIFTSPLSNKNRILNNIKKKKILNIISTSYVKKIKERKEIKKKKEIIIGYVGSFDFSKCKSNLINLLDVKSKKNVKIVLIGNTQSNLIKKQIQNCKNIKNFEIYVNLSNDEVIKKMSRFDIFAYPLNKNHFGTNDLSLQQAIKLNIPQIVMNNSMERWMIKKTMGGIIAKNNRDFKDKLTRLVDNKKLRRRLVLQNFKNKKSDFCMKNMLANFDKLFLDIFKIKKNLKKYKFYGKSKFELYIETLNKKKIIRSLASSNFVKKKIKEIKRKLNYNDWMPKTKSTPFHYHYFFKKDRRLKILCKNLKKIYDVNDQFI